MDESIFDSDERDETQEPSPESGGDVEQERAEIREEQGRTATPQEPDAREGAQTNPGGPGF